MMTENDSQSGGPAEQTPRGSMRFQDQGSTRPRPPTVGEQRARLAAEAKAEADEVEYARRRKSRRRVMIGGGVVAGIAALVATGYALGSPSETNASCTSNGDDVISAEDNCDETYVRSHGGYSSGGFFFLPIGGGGYRQYQYYYGGNGGPIGSRASGGSYTAPSHSTVKTSSGKTVSRGGFGISGSSKSGGS
jgi:hypothetical protein